MRISVPGIARISVALSCVLFFSLSARAETKTVRIAKQFGISYLPLTVMEESKLLEKHAKELGVDVSVEWLRFTGGSGMNDAILSGNLDFASGGIGPLLIIWSKTQKNYKVKGVAALNAMPLYLTTTNAGIKSLKDFTDKDRIALPGIKTSIQAVTLQMACEQVFGKGQGGKLDSITVSMGHPDAQAAMLGGHSEIDAHFGSAPFMYDELADPRVHKVLDSFQVVGGPHTFNTVWATSRFRDENPKIFQAFLDALQESMTIINDRPAAAAALWIKNEGSKMTPEATAAMIKLPENQWTITPKKLSTYANFMYETGTLTAKPESWKDVFFDNIHSLPGN
jgi:NitT/TauT family transport system substrate-binding protein